ncbi:universal stress protein [Nonomuraea harbinensis]|uniref:Universal stress protein n=1 Tax=Nonomuraea harbinensis TaxID=1286938 RepID=A0ABW1C919_9ACTN|nr:universal stress protein [Nonomuraea harbinensis]
MTDELGVVVGYDGSPQARQALRWGAAEAAARKSPLTIAHAWQWPHHEWPGELVPLELVRRPAQRLVKAAAAGVAHHHPEMIIDSVTGRDSPSALLADLSGQAALIVLGTRGYGTLHSMAAGSVSGHVAAHARCPVVVLRGDPAGRGARDIVAGFDGSRASMAALDFAAAQAHRLDSTLHVIIAQRGRGGQADTHELRIQTQGQAWDRLTCRQHTHPSLRTEVELIDEPARAALLEAAYKARLLVVGARGLGEVRGMLLGSVSQALVHRAPCPVAVVHAR